MKLKYLLIVFCFLISNSLIAQEEMNSSSEETVTENEFLYNFVWKLEKCKPEFDNNIGIKLEFNKDGKQLKVTKELTSIPKLEGTKLITKKTENVNFYSWEFGALDTVYEGDNVVSETKDYSKLILLSEGYEFKIKELNATSLVLEVLKAPKVIFGKSIFSVEEMHFTNK